jgi:sentrin-specific protease 1
LLENTEDSNQTRRGYCYDQVKQWGRRRTPTGNLFDLEYLFVPINRTNTHWMSAMINFPGKTITFYDSMGDPGHGHLRRLIRYLHDEHSSHHGQPLSEDWTLITCPGDTPKQNNSSDCGVYTCLFAEQLMKGQPPRATPADAHLFRLRMALSIVTNSVTLG